MGLYLAVLIMLCAKPSVARPPSRGTVRLSSPALGFCSTTHVSGFGTCQDCSADLRKVTIGCLVLWGVLLQIWTIICLVIPPELIPRFNMQTWFVAYLFFTYWCTGLQFPGGIQPDCCARCRQYRLEGLFCFHVLCHPTFADTHQTC